MRTRGKTSKKRWYVGGALGLAVVTGSYLVWGALASGDQADRLLTEIRTTPPEQRFEHMRALRTQTENMTEEERRKVFEGMREMFEEQMEKRIAEYEEAPEDQKQQVLDRHIDEMVAWRERRRAERENDPNRPPRRNGDAASGPDRGPDGGREGAGAANTGQRGGRRGPPTVQQRKERLEGRNPDQQVRRMRYRMKAMERAKERGIDLGGRGGPGGFGGRPGGR